MFNVVLYVLTYGVPYAVIYFVSNVLFYVITYVVPYAVLYVLSCRVSFGMSCPMLSRVVFRVASFYLWVLPTVNKVASCRYFVPNL